MSTPFLIDIAISIIIGVAVGKSFHRGLRLLFFTFELYKDLWRSLMSRSAFSLYISLSLIIIAAVVNIANGVRLFFFFYRR